MIGAQIGLDFRIVSRVIAVVTSEVIAVILRLTGYFRPEHSAALVKSIVTGCAIWLTRIFPHDQGQAPS
jgi:hypothetical protein